MRSKREFAGTTDNELRLRRLALQLELLAIETEEENRDQRVRGKTRGNGRRQAEVIRDVKGVRIRIGQRVRVLSRTRSRTAPFYRVTRATVTGFDHRGWVTLEARKETDAGVITVRSVRMPDNIEVINENESNNE